MTRNCRGPRWVRATSHRLHRRRVRGGRRPWRAARHRRRPAAAVGGFLRRRRAHRLARRHAQKPLHPPRRPAGGRHAYRGGVPRQGERRPLCRPDPGVVHSSLYLEVYPERSSHPQRLDALIPQLPELLPMIGKTVDIIVLEEGRALTSLPSRPHKVRRPRAGRSTIKAGAKSRINSEGESRATRSARNLRKPLPSGGRAPARTGAPDGRGARRHRRLLVSF